MCMALAWLSTKRCSRFKMDTAQLAKTLERYVWITTIATAVCVDSFVITATPHLVTFTMT